MLCFVVAFGSFSIVASAASNSLGTAIAETESLRAISKDSTSVFGTIIRKIINGLKTNFGIDSLSVVDVSLIDAQINSESNVASFIVNLQPSNAKNQNLSVNWYREIDDGEYRSVSSGELNYRCGEYIQTNCNLTAGKYLCVITTEDGGYRSTKDVSKNITLKLDTDGGTFDGKTVPVEYSYILPTPEKDGLNCIGWTDVKGGTTVKYSLNTSYTPHKNTTLYAVYRNKGKVTVNLWSNDG